MFLQKIFALLAIVAFSLIASCTSDDTASPLEPIVTDGVVTASVDASNYDNWVYYNLDQKKEVTVNDPENSADWDVAFKRMRIKVNGGSSGKMGYSVISLGVAAFDTVSKAPQKFYTADDSIYFPMNPTEPYSGNKILENWYNMAGMPPLLSSKNEIYLIKRGAKDYVKFQITSYYNSTTNASANINFKYRTGLSAGNETILHTTEKEFDVTSSTDWVYYSFSDNAIVQLDTIPEWDYNWDIAFRRYQVKTNSGMSGSNSNNMLNNSCAKGFGVIDLGLVDFNTTRTASSTGYISDTKLTPPMGGAEFSGSPVLGNWYTMAGMPPAFSSKNHVYMVKTENGRYTKLQILEYKNNATGGKNLKIRYENNISTRE